MWRSVEPSRIGAMTAIEIDSAVEGTGDVLDAARLSCASPHCGAAQDAEWAFDPDGFVRVLRSRPVTDFGGMTRHAAIVSRELGIPCVVGTGTATATLRGGELVTVDATHGVVVEGRFQPAVAAPAVG